MSAFTPGAVSQYADDVVRLLAGDFPDLCDPVTADIVRERIVGHAMTGSYLEVAVDNPFIANWRLVRDRNNHRAARLACWRQNLTQADLERLRRLNPVLAALGEEMER